MKHVRIFFASTFITLIAAFPIVGFQLGCSNLSSSFVATERQTFNALKPYLEKETVAYPADAGRVNDAVQAWDLKLSAAEKSVGLPTQPTTQP